jgi:hypothetical protein
VIDMIVAIAIDEATDLDRARQLVVRAPLRAEGALWAFLPLWDLRPVWL